MPLVKEIEDDYLRETDWEVKENANETRSFGNLMSYFLDKYLKSPEVLMEVFPSQAVKEHFNSDIHIHKLPQALWIPYCVGWSLPNILALGLKTPTVNSKPAKHLDAAVAQLVNFTFLTAQEFSGAMAFSGFDLFLAPFVRHDKLDEKRIKQILQGLLFELNYPSRMGFQSPFSNITLFLDTIESFLHQKGIVGGKLVDEVGNYLPEALKLSELFIRLCLEGDEKGQPFTFPIPTLMVTKRFDWDGRRWGDLTDLIFEVSAKRGTFYWLNGHVADIEGLYAMCCRLTIQIKKVMEKARNKEIGERLRKNALRGYWAFPDATGSIGYVTINLPRLAFQAKGEFSRFEQLLLERLEIARQILMRMRERYVRSLKLGLMPMTRVYLGTFDNHFSTFGLTGLPEAAANLFKNPKLWEELNEREVKDALDSMKKTIRVVNDYCKESEETDGCLYNVEQSPAESTAFKFASADLKKFKEFIDLKEILIPTQDGTPFYSSSIVPYYALASMDKRIEWEAEVQKEFTGGVIAHFFLHEAPDPEALKRFVKRIVTKTKIVYFSITPTIAICRDCDWQGIGLFEVCPKCKSKRVDLWSRIVGYYRPIRTWNIGKRAEFERRVHYSGDFSSLKVRRIE